MPGGKTSHWRTTIDQQRLSRILTSSFNGCISREPHRMNRPTQLEHLLVLCVCVCQGCTLPLLTLMCCVIRLCLFAFVFFMCMCLPILYILFSLSNLRGGDGGMRHSPLSIGRPCRTSTLSRLEIRKVYTRATIPTVRKVLAPSRPHPSQRNIHNITMKAAYVADSPSGMYPDVAVGDVESAYPNCCDLLNAGHSQQLDNLTNPG